jgi:hypothetical protein
MRDSLLKEGVAVYTAQLRILSWSTRMGTSALFAALRFSLFPVALRHAAPSKSLALSVGFISAAICKGRILRCRIRPKFTCDICRYV